MPIAPDKMGYQVNIFLFLHKNMSWVIIRSISKKHIEALLMSTHNIFLWRNKKILFSIILVGKDVLSGAMIPII